TDLLTHRLTGEWTASLDNATAKWNYVRPLGGWPLEVLKAAGLEELPDKWPRRVLPVGSVVGPLDRAAADAPGRSPGRRPYPPCSTRPRWPRRAGSPPTPG